MRGIIGDSRGFLFYFPMYLDILSTFIRLSWGIEHYGRKPENSICSTEPDKNRK